MIDVSSCSHYHLERRYDFVTRRTVAGVSEEPGQNKKKKKKQNKKSKERKWREIIFYRTTTRGYGRRILETRDKEKY